MDDSPDWIRIAFHADQRAIQRHAVDERLRAVDRIENPAEAAGARPLAQFFAENRVVRKGRGDTFAQQLFRVAVGDRHG